MCHFEFFKSLIFSSFLWEKAACARLNLSYFVSEKRGHCETQPEFFFLGGISTTNGRHFRVIIVAVEESAKVVNFHL